ncbi:MAG: 50S ribosomal protein L1 [Candidatus Uhrbacteria bacterium]|nr:50S ribosomal protein L1 [Candidatus Uhrbacteria bacterium]
MPSTRFTQAKALVEKKKVYTIPEAIALSKKTATAKYDEAMELHIRLGIDATKSDQQIRGTIALPHGTGKTKKIIAFVEPEKEADAKSAGADIVGGEELINTIATKGIIDFDVAVATPAMMPKLAKLARLLGPRGLMPNPKTDTVSPNIVKMVTEQKAGKESFKNDPQGNLHQIFGRKSFSEAQLEANLRALLDTVKRMKPQSSKGIYLRSSTIASSVGPGIKIDPNS